MTLLDAISLIMSGWYGEVRHELYSQACSVITEHAEKLYLDYEIEALKRQRDELGKGDSRG